MEPNLLLIIVSGLPGTGKSTFAAALAKNINALHLNTDVIRDQLGLRGKYDAETKARIYQEMLSTTRFRLKENQNVIVDATFSNNEWRERFQKLADELHCTISWLVVEANEAIIRERVAKKRVYSEADFSVYKKVRDNYDPIRYTHLVLRSDEHAVHEMIEQAKQYLYRSEKNS
ncbi:MAG: ATP-binding protein [Bacteroidia bacterium]|nr:ATP-binding protein [Bacteroidia bacterium]